MKTYVTSDIHLNHRNIQLYCPKRQVIPVSQFDENGKPVVTDKMIHAMNERIISNWNAKVNPEDTVYILGDVAMGKIDKAPELIRRLNGSKILIRGNHDKTLVQRRDGISLADDLFDTIHSYYEVSYRVADTGKKKLLVMSHFPISHWNAMDANIDKTSIHFHGHLHSSPSKRHVHKGAILDVGLDASDDFSPWLMEDAINCALNNAKVNPAAGHHD